MTLNFDTLTEERQDELELICTTKILLYLVSNISKGISPRDLMEKCAEYSNSPEELTFMTYLVTGASVSSGLI